MPAGTFRCDVFGPWDPGRSCPGSLEVAADSFRIALDEGRSLSLPSTRVRLSRGGFDHLHIVIEGETETGEAIYASVQGESLLDYLTNFGPAELRLSARALSGQGASTRNWLAISFLIFLSFVAGLAFFIWSGFGFLVDRAVNLVPAKLEMSLGEAVVSSFISGNHELKQGPVFDAVIKVWNRVLQGVPADQPYKLHIYVIDGPGTVNAFAAPGGHVVVFTGLVKELDSPEELAGIIGHELQHVLRKHPLKGILQSAGLAMVVSIIFGDASGLTVLIQEYGPALARLSYSREQEREADRGAVDLLVKARIDPTRFPEFFKRMQARGNGVPAALTMLSSHPGHEERAKNLKLLFDGLQSPTYEPIEADWASARAAIPTSPATAPAR